MIAGYEFDAAIAAHRNWRMHFDLTISGVESMNVMGLATPMDPERCALGKWLELKSSELGSLTSYAAVVDSHERFHRLAGKLVEAMGGAQPGVAAELIQGPLTDQSNELERLLGALRII